MFSKDTIVVLPVIKEKLGDTKDPVREKTQVLVQQLMQDSVSSPQVSIGGSEYINEIT